MISKKMETALNKQINQEIYSAYMYLSMSAHFAEKNLNGFAHWMRMQYAEELAHAGKLFDYVLDRDGSIKLEQVDAPPQTWRTTLAACQAAFKAETDNTKQINKLIEQSTKEADHATRVILQWFVQEQVEEESSARNLVEQVKLAGNAPGALLILDRELGSRTAGAAE